MPCLLLYRLFKMGKSVTVVRYGSPCGDLLVGEWDGQICMCDWAEGRVHERVLTRLRRYLPMDDFMQCGLSDVKSGTALASAVRQLDEYFNRIRTDFDMPLMLVGTEFQQKVWHALLAIPYGTTLSYGELAMRVGRASSVRAVANAVGANPVSIIVPCHRVVGSDGSLTGYAGGLAAKRMLLSVEQV